jgi:hypothetical protein
MMAGCARAEQMTAVTAYVDDQKRQNDGNLSE